MHNGYTSLYSVDSNSGQGGDLQETYFAAIGQPWHTQDLSQNYGTPKLLAGTSPVAVVHGGYTSVYTVNGNNHHLQETYLSALGANWISQDLSGNYGTPATISTPTAVVHDGYTSIYTADQNTNDVQETYLTNIGAPWATQDLTTKYGTPTTAATPIALLHPAADGSLTWSSVYTINEFNDHLQETYLSGIGANWITQDLSTKYGTPPALVAATGTDQWSAIHDGYTSVYTVDKGTNHLQETFLTALGQPWQTQDLSAKYGTPTDENANSPAAVVHSGWTSVYTVDNNGDLQETYLPGIGDAWITQDLSSKYGTPAVATANPPVPIYHTGYTSIYTIDASNHHVQETFLGGIGQAWISQDLTTKYGTPAADQAPTAVLHYDTNGAQTYTSIYTVDQGTDDLQET